MNKTLAAYTYRVYNLYFNTYRNHTLLEKLLVINNSTIMEKKEDVKEQDDSTVLNESGTSDDLSTSSSSIDQAEGEASETEMEKIRRYFTEKLSFLKHGEEEETSGKILPEPTLDGVVKFIKDHNVTKIVTMAGAGISTSAGIPDFRSPKSGLYHNLDKYNLPHPQAIFELNFFKSNPEPFFVLAKELLPEGFKPTPSHYFIKLLNDKGLLLRHYTQNIDTLERVAGLPEDKLVEAHGTFHTGRCLTCSAPFDLNWMKERIKESTVPKCEDCSEGVVKPDIVFFGEMLPDRFHSLIEKDFPQAELLIIMGSSLLVQPFASLVDRVKSTCPRLLINKEKVGMPDRLTRFLGIRSGMNFDAPNSRDVAWLGECDAGCQLLADKLGWGEELKDLITKEHQRLDIETEEMKKWIAKGEKSLKNEKASNR